METTKIDPGIEELMERIRQHARESRLDRSRDTTDPSASSSPPVALPPVPSTKQLTMKAPKSEKLLTLLEHARGKTDVSRNIPKFLHRLFRKQGGFNRLLLESLTLLLRTSLDLHKQTSGVVAHIQAQTRWFEALVNAREEDLGRVADIEHRVESAEVSHADSTAHLEQRDDALEKRLDNFSRDLAQRDDAVGKRLDSFSRDLAQGDDALEKRLDNFSRDLAQRDDAVGKRLDSFSRDLAQRDDAVGKRLDNFSRDLAQRDDAVGKRLDSLSRDLAAIGRELSAAAAHLGRLQAHTELTEVSSKAVLTQLERDVSQLRRDAGMALVSANRVDERQFADSSHFRAQLSVFTKLLRAEAERQSDGLSVAADTRPTLTPANIDNGLADAFYLAFEDAFRGPRANIKSRQAIYIPYIAKVNEGE
ncbi:MAG: hypothetical protein H0X73_12390, partial [Chthoniobacterales bacterium]|nr:hypothetical protein [Chthoniobacterales bacterium]